MLELCLRFPGLWCPYSFLSSEVAYFWEALAVRLRKPFHLNPCPGVGKHSECSISWKLQSSPNSSSQTPSSWWSHLGQYRSHSGDVQFLFERSNFSESRECFWILLKKSHHLHLYRYFWKSTLTSGFFPPKAVKLCSWPPVSSFC